MEVEFKTPKSFFPLVFPTDYLQNIRLSVHEERRGRRAQGTSCHLLTVEVTSRRCRPPFTTQMNT